METAMRYLLLVALLATACSSNDGGDVAPVNPAEMGRPLDLERARSASQDAPDRAPDTGSTSRVLATVDSDVITYRAVLLRIGPQLAVLGEDAQKREVVDQALVDILRDRIMYHAALEAGVTMSRDAIDEERTKRVKEIERSGGTLGAFLSERGMTRREYDEEIRRGRMVELYMRSAIGLAGGDPRVRPMTDTFVAPGLVRSYWERHAELFTEPAHAKLRVMSVKVDRRASDPKSARAAAKSRIERAQRRLRAGEDWVPVYRETAPKQAEEDPYGLQEIRRGDRSAVIEDFAFTSPKGTVSKIQELRTAFLLMQAEGAQEERVVPYEEVQDRIRAQLAKVRRQVAYYEVELQLLEDAVIRPDRREDEIRALLSKSRRALLDKFGL